MGGNILTAIQAIVEKSSLEIVENPQGDIQNRANQMGAAFEDFVKNAFAGCLDQDIRSIKKAYSRTFSYLGNSTNPPDAMLINSDAIEIKKIKDNQDKKENYVAYWKDNTAFYEISGKMEKEEFLKMIKNIRF